MTKNSAAVSAMNKTSPSAIPLAVIPPGSGCGGIVGEGAIVAVVCCVGVGAGVAVGVAVRLGVGVAFGVAVVFGVGVGVSIGIGLMPCTSSKEKVLLTPKRIHPRRRV